MMVTSTCRMLKFGAFSVSILWLDLAIMEGGSLGRRQAAASIAGKGKASGGGGSQEQSIVGGDSGYLSFMGMASTFGIGIVVVIGLRGEINCR